VAKPLKGNNMSGGGLTGKNLGELALLGAVGVATDGFGLAAAAPEAAGAGAGIAEGAGAAAGAGLGASAGTAGAGAAGSGGLAGLTSTALDTTLPADQLAAINGVNPMVANATANGVNVASTEAGAGLGGGAGAGAGAAGAGEAAATNGVTQSAVSDNALYANAINQGATTGAGTTNALGINSIAHPWLYSVTTPSATASGLWGTGAGAGAAGQAGMLGLGGLGTYEAMQAQKKAYGVPGVSTPDGPLQHLYGAGGVRSQNNPWQQTKTAATGGLMRAEANPNAPMAYNHMPAYNRPASTPTPQPVLHFSNRGSVPNADASVFSANSNWQLAMEQNAANQQAMQEALQAQSNPNQGFGLSSQPTPYAAGGGISSLGHYSDGGQMLKGPGDGMSDSIPATINNKQPARLANDEFVVPADVVSHIGNGSSDAGAKKLYDMMDRVRRARTGSPKQAKAIHPDRYMPG